MFAKAHLTSIILEAKQCLSRIGKFRFFDMDAGPGAGPEPPPSPACLFRVIESAEGAGPSQSSLQAFFSELDARRHALIDAVQSDVVAQLSVLVRDVNRIEGPAVAFRMAHLFNAMTFQSMSECLEESIDGALEGVAAAATARHATFHVTLQYNAESGQVEYSAPLSDLASAMTAQIRQVAIREKGGLGGRVSNPSNP